MTKIEALDGTILSLICKEITPVKYDATTIKTKLLDGSYHVQTIGTPARYVEFTVQVNPTQADSINLMQSQGETVKLTGYDETFYGKIDEPAAWERITIGYSNRSRVVYEARLKLIIDSGVV
ncbi:hypothetical protein [Anaerotalea alkaliphila]|uniref:Uncharacterized protein n=1 Tax=Anaerotalea alkaliphila TaxID=2662126 RepID=A0A7X5HWL9_9FIRM|nr:hypothetical protein [Anaerotalea alkaliphila]NDL68015.1 hypothetical protein [Anaerotalea alkaliphila]